MIEYSTNWMGPINMDWYRERGLTKKVDYFDAEIDEITTRYSAGRIDIYGVPDEPYPLEYSLAPMHSEDWNDFSNWLDNFASEELLTYEQLIETYEETTERKIRWWSDDK